MFSEYTVINLLQKKLFKEVQIITLLEGDNNNNNILKWLYSSNNNTIFIIMILDTQLYYHVNSYDFIPNRVTFITSTLVEKLLM